MFRASPGLQSKVIRLPLSPKKAGKEYYKGNRVGSMGTINKHGNFSPDWNKIRTYVYPQGTKNFNMTPFVGASIEKVRATSVDGNYDNYESYPRVFTGEDYLREWKMLGGHDIMHTAEEVAKVRTVNPANVPVPYEDPPKKKE